MGTLSDTIDAVTGKAGADAAEKAAALQLQGTQEGIAELKAGREQAFEALSPFREAGAGQLEGISSLVSDPAAQRDFIQNNPFFNTLANRAQRTLFQNQAAKGKLGSGGTAESLQTSLLGLGNQLLNQSITQRMNLATLGANAAAGQSTATQQASGGIADLIGQGANAQAAGVVGAANARTGAVDRAIGLGVLAASDRSVKRDVEKIGSYKEFPVYKFKYIWDDEEQIGLMAQDVEETLPEAIIEIDGIKHIDYGVVYAH